MTTDVSDHKSNAANAAGSSKLSNDSVRILSTLTRLIARNTAIKAVRGSTDCADAHDDAATSAVATDEAYARAANEAYARAANEAYAGAKVKTETRAAGVACGDKGSYDFAGVAVFDELHPTLHDSETSQVVSGYAAVAIQSLPPEYRKSALEYKPIELSNRRIVALKGCALIPIVIDVPLQSEHKEDSFNKHVLEKFLKKYSKRLYKFNIVDTKFFEPVANSIGVALNHAAAVADAKAAADVAYAHHLHERSIEDLLARNTDELDLNESSHIQASISQAVCVKEIGMCIRQIDDVTKHPKGNTIRLQRFDLQRYLSAFRMTPLRYFTEISTFLQSLPSQIRMRVAERILVSNFSPTKAIDFSLYISHDRAFTYLSEAALFYRSAIAEQADAQRLSYFYLRKNPTIANQFSPEVHTSALKLQRILQLLQDTDYSALYKNKLKASPADINAYIELHTKNAQFMLQGYIKKLMRTAATAIAAADAASADANADAAASAVTEAMRDAASMVTPYGGIEYTDDSIDPYLDSDAFEVSKMMRLPDDTQCALILGDTTVVALERIQYQLVRDMVRRPNDRDHAAKLLAYLIYAGLSCGHVLNLLCTIAVEQVCSSVQDHEKARWSERYEPSSCLLQVLLHTGCNIMNLHSGLMSYLLKVNTVSDDFGLSPYTATNKYMGIAIGLLSTEYAKRHYANYSHDELNHSQAIDIATHLTVAERALITKIVQTDDLYAHTQGLTQLGFESQPYKASSRSRYTKIGLALLSLLSDKFKSLANGIARHYIDREYKRLQNCYQLQAFGYKDDYLTKGPNISGDSKDKVYEQMLRQAYDLSDELQAHLFDLTSDIRFFIGVEAENAVNVIRSYQNLIKRRTAQHNPDFQEFFTSYALGVKHLQLCFAVLTGQNPAYAVTSTAISAAPASAAYAGDTEAAQDAATTNAAGATNTNAAQDAATTNAAGATNTNAAGATNTNAAQDAANTQAAGDANTQAAGAAEAACDELHAAMLSGFAQIVEGIEAVIGSVLHITTEPAANSSLIKLNADAVCRLLTKLQSKDSASYAIVSRLLAHSRAIEPEEMRKLIIENNTEALRLPHSFTDLSLMLNYVDGYGNTVQLDHSDNAFIAYLQSFDLNEAPELDKDSVKLLCKVYDDLIHCKGIFDVDNSDPELAIKVVLLLAEPNLLMLANKYEIEFHSRLANKAIYRYREHLSGVTVFKLMLAMESDAVITSLRPETVESFLQCISLMPTDCLNDGLEYFETTTATQVDAADGVTNILRGSSWTMASIIYLTFLGLQRRIDMLNDPDIARQIMDYYKAPKTIDLDNSVPECLNFEMEAKELPCLAKIFCNSLLTEHSEFLIKLLRALDLQDAFNAEIKNNIAQNKMISFNRLSPNEQRSFKIRLTNSFTMTERFRQSLATIFEYSLDSLDEPELMIYHSITNDAPKLSELIANSGDLSAVFNDLKPHNINAIIHTMAHAENTKPLVIACAHTPQAPRSCHNHANSRIRRRNALFA